MGIFGKAFSDHPADMYTDEHKQSDEFKSWAKDNDYNVEKDDWNDDTESKDDSAESSVEDKDEK